MTMMMAGKSDTSHPYLQATHETYISSEEDTGTEVLLGTDSRINHDFFVENGPSSLGGDADNVLKLAQNMKSLYMLVFLNAFSVGLYLPSIPELLLDACDGDLPRATLLQGYISSLVCPLERFGNIFLSVE